MDEFDAIIMCAVQAGPFLGARLAAVGCRVALIEREHLGGTCVNDGCMPAKTMLARARGASRPPGLRLRRRWLKLHLGVDATTGEIAAHVLTHGGEDDAVQVPDLLRQCESAIASLAADGAYDRDTVYQAAAFSAAKHRRRPRSSKRSFMAS